MFHSNCIQSWLQTSISGFDWSIAGFDHCSLTLKGGLLIKNGLYIQMFVILAVAEGIITEMKY